jgi:hypothetical protein
MVTALLLLWGLQQLPASSLLLLLLPVLPGLPTLSTLSALLLLLLLLLLLKLLALLLCMLTGLVMLPGLLSMTSRQLLSRLRGALLLLLLLLLRCATMMCGGHMPCAGWVAASVASGCSSGIDTADS